MQSNLAIYMLDSKKYLVLLVLITNVVHLTFCYLKKPNLKLFIKKMCDLSRVMQTATLNINKFKAKITQIDDKCESHSYIYSKA